jgi:HlyD family secretion protein
MQRRTWIYATLFGTALVLLLAWAFAPRPVEVETGRAVRGPFETTIDEDAKTRLRERYVVSAPLAGLLQRPVLREGDLVEVQDVVARLTPVLSPLLDERSLREQRARLEITQAQVQRVKARVEGAKLALQQANNEMQRTEQLARQGFVSPTKLDTDRLAALSAQKELEAAIEERHIAEHEVEQARAALAAISASGEFGAASFELHSPVAGRVLRILQPNEAAVTLGTPLLELGDTGNLEVVAELLTTDALRARPGSRVRIERWGGDGLLEGRVRLVEPGAFTKVSALGVEEQRVKVLIDITTPAAKWRALGDGYRVGVRIVTLSLDDVLKVPASAVFPLPGSDAAAPGGMAVFRILDGRALLTPVRVGARNAGEAWIEDGLATGDKVVVYPPATVRDGVRVKPRHV